MEQLDFPKMFDSFVANNQKGWAHDRSSTIGASELFACIREVGFKKRGEEFGYEEDEEYENSWGAMERGNLIEDHWVVPVLDAELPQGAGFLYAGSDQITFISGLNSATPDGLITDLKSDALAKYGIKDIESDCVGLEIKSIDPRVTLDEAKSVHFGQTIAQMALIRENTDFKPMYTVLLYVDASFLDDMTIFIVKFDPQIYKSGQIRAEKIFNADTLAELQPEGKLGNDCNFCAWRYACAKVSGESIPTAISNPDIDQELLDRIHLLVLDEREADETEKYSKEKKERLRANIKTALVEAETRRVHDPRFKVSWIMQKGRKTLDKAAAEADGIDLSFYTKEGPGFDKMTVKLMKDENDD
jgi:hypothetical protein